MEDAAKKSFLKALNKIQGTIEPIKKDSTNPHFKSRYASLAAVNEAVMPLLTENGFTLVQGGVQASMPGDHRTFLRTTLTHIDGHSMWFDYPLTVSDNPQHVASSLTYARRYSICSLFNLSLEDDDGNAAAIPTTTRKPANESEEKPEDTQTSSSDRPESNKSSIMQFVPKEVTTRSVEIKNGKKAGSTATMFS